MNGMGDIRVDVHTLLRRARPAGRRARARRPASRRRGRRATPTSRLLIADEDERFEVDPRLSAEEREDHARMQLGLERVLRDGRLRRLLDPLRRDRRGRPLRAAAARRRLEPDGRRLRLRRRGRRADRRADVAPPGTCSARRSSPRCTRWTSRRDSILMSHMGEGNWALARADRPVRLIKRPLGIGGLDDPPTFLFQYADRAGTLATLVVARRGALPAGRRRGRDPRHRRAAGLEMPYGLFRPASGVRQCMNAWLRLGGPHHQVLNPGTGQRTGRSSASWPAWSSRRCDLRCTACGR